MARSSLGLLHVIFCKLYQNYGPWFMPKFRLAQYLESLLTFYFYFIYAFLLTRTSLELLHIIFRTFVLELWPLICAKFSFPFSILGTNGPNFNKLFILTRSMLGLLAVNFRKFVRELWPLIDVRITLPLNIMRYSGLLLHAWHCSGTIVRFSDNSSFIIPNKT